MKFHTLVYTEEQREQLLLMLKYVRQRAWQEAKDVKVIDWDEYFAYLSQMRDVVSIVQQLQPDMAILSHKEAEALAAVVTLTQMSMRVHGTDHPLYQKVSQAWLGEVYAAMCCQLEVSQNDYLR